MSADMSGLLACYLCRCGGGGAAHQPVSVGGYAGPHLAACLVACACAHGCVCGRACVGGSPARVEAARSIVEAGVAVMGHVGLTPQSISVLGRWQSWATWG